MMIQMDIQMFGYELLTTVTTAARNTLTPDSPSPSLSPSPHPPEIYQNF